MANNVALLSFNAGELSPKVDTRVDMDKYRAGCRRLENMIPTKYGGATKRPGFEYIATSYGAAETVRMIPFVYNAEIAYQCEFGEEYIRFYYDGEILEDGGGNEVVISTPYAAEHLFELQVEQIGDVLWIVHPRYRQRQLSRTAAYNFSLDTIDFEKGPFLTRNDLIDTDTTATASMTVDVTGAGLTGTMTCDIDYFLEGHVGALFKLTYPRETQIVTLSGTGTTDPIRGEGEYSFITRGTWTGSIEIQRRDSSAGWYTFREYKSSNGQNQNISLAFTEDELEDAQYRLYSADGSVGLRGDLSIQDGLESGIVRVTGFTDSKTVSILVVSTVPSTDATRRFAEGGWSDLRGYPGALAFFEDRCCYAGTVLDSDGFTTPNTGYTGIASIQDLKDIANDLDGDYELLTDLDLSGESDWTPLGEYSGSPFTGTLNGRGHTIKNLTMTGSERVGLFEYVTGTIENLFLEDVTMVGFRRCGALVAQTGAATITDCHIDGLTLTSSSDSLTWCGALVGSNAATVTRCSAKNVSFVFNDCTYLGGLLGLNTATVTDCFARGTVTAKAAFDSLTGFGGLVGQSSGDYVDSYASMTRPDSTGSGFIGTYSAGSFTTCYWDTTVSGTSNGVDGGNQAGCSGLTSTQLKSEANYTGFDFTDTWTIDEGYDYAYLQAVKAISQVQFAGESTVWLSASGDYNNFAAGVNDDDSFSLQILSTDRILWLSGLDNLLIGTAGSEYVIRSNKLDTPLTPTNFGVKRQTTYGSKYMQPIPVDQSVLFVDYVGRKVHELTYTYENERYVAPDLTILAEHITESGIVNMAYQKNPDSILWCVLTDGSLISFVYDREQNVVAWSDHLIDGTVQSVSVITAADEDEVWISVTREINSSDVVYIERMSSRTFDTKADCFFVDSGVTYQPQLLTLDSAPTPAAWVAGATITGATSGTTAVVMKVRTSTTYEIGYLDGDFTDGEVLSDGTNSRDCGAGYPTVAATTSTTVGKLDHLVGETVTVLGDGTVYTPDAVVDANGLVTIGTAVAKAQSGLSFTSTLQPMRIVVNTQTGSSMGAITRINDLKITFLNTDGVSYGDSESSLYTIDFDGEQLVDAAYITDLFSGDVPVVMTGGYSPENPIIISSSQPLPMTVKAIIASFEQTGR